MKRLIYRVYDIGDRSHLGPIPVACMECGTGLMLDVECGPEHCCGYQYRLEIQRIDLVVEQDVPVSPTQPPVAVHT